LFSFHNTKSYNLPLGFFLELENSPAPQDLNRLFSRCNMDTYSPTKLAFALDQSYKNISIIEEKTSKLYGYVRITTDKGLNANLWDLVALPCKHQKDFLAILISNSIAIIRRELPGCSISIAASQIALKIIEKEGFIIDPDGIRVMSFRL
tara:strand:- start:67 stop:516 length:450 start_codon:yes stop_codon:yes gene_type:complete